MPIDVTLMEQSRAKVPAPYRPATAADLVQLIVRPPEWVGIDTETTGLEPEPYGDSRILGYSLAWQADEETLAVYVPVGHRPGLFESNEQLDVAVEVLQAVRNVKHLCYHTAAFDVRFLRQLIPDWDLTNNVLDVHTLARVLALEAETEHGLGLGLVDLFVEHCKDDPGGEPFIDFQRSMKSGSRAHLDTMPLETVSVYAEADAYMTLMLAFRLQEHLDDSTKQYLWDVECRFARLLMRMEDHGIMVDRDYVVQMQEQMRERQAEVGRRLKTHGLVNVGSPKEEAAFLYDRLGLKPRMTTATGHRSVSRKALLPHERHPVVKLIKEHRQLTKANSSWLVPLLDGSRIDGRIHAHWNVAGTRSGRISCSGPNLQAIPFHNRGLSYGSLAGVLTAPEGWELLSFDYKQADLRMATVVAREGNMAKVFGSGGDPYMEMAEMIFGERDRAKRQLAKQFSLATINAIGSKTAAKQFELPQDLAKRAISGHRKAFPNFVVAGHFFERKIQRDGHVVLWTGRHLRLASMEASHKAFSRVVQGGVAEIVKRAMVFLDEKLQELGLESLVVGAVHDSVVLEVKECEKATVTKLARQILMETLPEKLRNHTNPPVVLAIDVTPWASVDDE